ncbi:hypothetical protein [Spirosoma rhododendri]|uniref:Glycosyltransferase RgtA/B/C/D-like domain-containing protein n=1 Tax=Spirosoma rhododendri TaxID=2728024 RepID=A0A7L5DSF4_9BACT|nr:hypothetical protein [Spirosoma rhododendri]QJD78897.1 hypothetical protein HH216_11005 [Spirosoma rhododendri]
MKFYQVVALLLIGLAYTAVFIANNYLMNGLYGDEIHFWPTVLLFSHEPIPSAHLLNTYPEVIAPLPFMVGGWVINVFGESLQHLRLLSFTLSFGILTLFLAMSPNAKRFWLAALGLVAFPYYYFCSTLFYTDMTALTFILLGWVAYLKRVHWASCLCFVAAVSSRQYAVVFPLIILCYETLPALFADPRPGTITGLMRQKPYLFFYVLAGLTLAGWLLFWKGLGPAPEIARQKYNGTVYQPSYQPGFVLYAAACLGLYYVLPELLLTRRFQFYALRTQSAASVLGWLVLIGLLVTTFPAVQMNDGFFVVPNLGFFDRHLEMVGISGTTKQILFGGLMFLTVLRFASPVSGLAGWVVLLNLLLMGKAHIAWDKYLMPTVATLWLLTLFDAHWPAAERNMRPSTLIRLVSRRVSREPAPVDE